MFKILIISVITFMLVIITFLILMSFMNVDIKTNSKQIEKFIDEDKEPKYTGAFKYNVYASTTEAYIQFNSSGTLTIPSSLVCDIFIIGGGGGAGYNHGSGGGAGAYYYGVNQTLKSGTYNINIGSGGAGGTYNNSPVSGGDSFISLNGRDLTFNNLNVRCKGGGAGGYYRNAIGIPGGCGGGADGWNGISSTNTTYQGGGTNNTGTIGTGYSGGSARQNYSTGALAAGGGGGIGDVGKDANGVNGGNGGNGLIINIIGIEQVYGGGGGGGEWPAYAANPAGTGGGATLKNGTFVKVGGDAVRSEGANGGDAIVNTGSGGGGGKGGRGGNGSSGVVIIRYKSSLNVNALSNLFKTKVPWGMYFGEDFNGKVLNDLSGNGRNATTTGTIIEAKGMGNGATGNISYIYGGQRDTITWPNGSIPENFTILSLTRWTGGSRQRILSSINGNWLHGHWGGRRGVFYYEGWRKGDPSIGNLDDWLCSISKNSSSTPNNILIDGIPNGQAGGGNGGGGYKLGINNNPWAGWGEVSDWALSCVIIWDRHLEDNEMLLLNDMINTYKVSAKSLIDIINNINNNMGSEDGEIIPLTKNEQYELNNKSFVYETQFDSDNIGDLVSLTKNDIKFDKLSTSESFSFFGENRYSNGKFKQGYGESITIVFKKPFILKKIMFIANDRKNAPAAWDIIIGGSTTISQKATLLDYDAFSGKSNNTCIKFLIDNKISSDTYKIVFKEVFEGTKLDFKKMVLFEGIKPEDISTASSSIERSS